MKKRKRGIENELSIFAPHASERIKAAQAEIKMERPVTPIDVRPEFYVGLSISCLHLSISKPGVFDSIFGWMYVRAER